MRGAFETARRAGHRLRHPLPEISTVDVQDHTPTVYFCTPDINYPTGGIRVVYRHADLLNEAGIPASVVHARSNFRCTWFENRTQVMSSREARIGPHDLIVVSEVGASVLRRLPAGFRFIVFNQNSHLTWSFPEARAEHYLRNPDLVALLTVSEHGREMLEYAAPGVPVRRVHNSIDPQVFSPGDARRPRRIAYMPRRGREEARQVFGLLRGRGALDGWEVTALEGLSEREVGEQLKSTSIFFNFTYLEGFGLPAAEAMACGAYVIGFHGFGGREFLSPEFSSPVEPGDVVAFAREFERVAAREAVEPGWCRQRGRAAATFIAQHYSPAREREDVIGIYRTLMKTGITGGDTPGSRLSPPAPVILLEGRRAPQGGPSRAR
jgi:glycosyltransferase involved in cell wall biosynthesis